MRTPDSRSTTPAGTRCRFGDGGAVTAELAVVLPGVTLILVLLLTGGLAAITQLRIDEAARAAARSLARGEQESVAAGEARRLAGNGATVTVSSKDGFGRAVVETTVPGPLGAVLPIQLRARTETRLEDRTGAPPPSSTRLPDDVA